MIVDPVTGFTYPKQWMERCPTPELLDDVSRGLAVLTSSGKVLKRGYSTGTTAAAASEASILSLGGEEVQNVSLTIPCGLRISVPVSARNGDASCIKCSGDNTTDVTAGVEILARAVPTQGGINLVPGFGIGRFTRTTPRNKRGDPAISSSAMKSIMQSIRDAMKQKGIQGVDVSLTIPQGPFLAVHTLNPKFGIEGGISILGTTGLVEPWDDHVQESVQERLASTDRPVLTTGRLGLRYSRLFFPDRDVILVGSGIRKALNRAQGAPILCGLPGLILKAIDPTILDGTGYHTIEEYATSPNFDKTVRSLLASFKREMPQVRVVLVSRDGLILGDSG